MAAETDYVCGFPFLAALYGACLTSLVSLGFSLAGLCSVEFPVIPRWRFAIISGTMGRVWLCSSTVVRLTLSYGLQCQGSACCSVP